MIRSRLSLAALLGLVFVCGLGLAAMRSPTVFWTTAATTVTLGLLLTGVLGAWFLRGPDRGFWAGFALFGGVYLLLVNWSWIGEQVGHDLTGGIRDAADGLFPPPTAPLRAPALPTSPPRFLRTPTPIAPL